MLKLKILNLLILWRVSSTESTVFIADFNADVGTDIDTWKCVIGQHRVGGKLKGTEGISCHSVAATDSAS